MSLESNGDQPVETTPENQLPFPIQGKIIYGLFIVLMPVLSFSLINIVKFGWQDGDISSYYTLTLLPQASVIFFPLIAYSILCYLLLLVKPVHYAKSFWIRLGIYTGTLLALQYSIAVFILSFESMLIILIPVWFSPSILTKIFYWGKSKWDEQNVMSALVAMVFFLGIGLIITFRHYISLLLFLGLLIAGPFWSFLIATRASIWLFKNHETKLTFPRGFGLTVWFAVYVTAWRYAILRTIELYNALPLRPPPDCYIATAAARGHPQIVGSQTLQRADGTSMQVNKQLQLLKCAELAIMAVAPRSHRLLRHLYDAIGKPLAQQIQNPFMADIAHLLLKPIEWLAELGLRVIVPQIDSISRRIYTK